jgi:uncharacterized DUF497 family protein
MASPNDKAVVNLGVHGVAFHEATKAFRDPFAVERIDARLDYGEDRINLVGMCDGALIQVTYKAQRARPALRTLIAPTRSAFSSKPHAMQAKRSCVWRFCAET